MTQRRSALGRGLGALISRPPAVPAVQPTPAGVAGPAGTEANGAEGTQWVGRGAEALEATHAALGLAGSASSSGGVVELEIARIDPNPDQPRREFEQGALAQLADSIRQHGVLQPVVVREAGARYELVMGERRFRASQLAGRRSIPAVILDVDPADRLELAIVENVQRQDLNPIELAYAYQALSQAGHTQEAIGKKVSMDRSSVANHIRLLELSRPIQSDVEAGRLSMGHAKALLQIPAPPAREALRTRILAESLSVRAAEEAARAFARGELGGTAGNGKPNGAATRAKGERDGAAAGRPLDPDTRAYLERLERRLQTKVELHPTAGGGGRLEIRYFSLEDLERIGNLLLGIA